jgi:hypothetical protein
MRARRRLIAQSSQLRFASRSVARNEHDTGPHAG